MSTGENKPGMRNISDLKARLGQLNKSAGGKPAEGAPAQGATELTADSDADLGMETQVVRLPPGAERAESAPPAAPPASRPSQAGAAPGFSAFDMGSANDLFKKPEAPPPKAPPPRAEAPAPPAEPRLDHPLQMGVFPDAPGQRTQVGPVEMTADDHDFIKSVEGVRGLRTRVAIAVCAFMVLLGALLGFMLGNGRIQRQLINAQIDRATIVRDQVFPLLEQYQALMPVVERMDTSRVSWDVIEALPVQLPPIDTGLILGGRVPLPEKTMQILGMGVNHLSAFFHATREHRRITLERDRAELEALSTGKDFESNDFFAVMYAPVDPKTPVLEYVPPKGQIVAVVGKPHPNETGEANVIPVKNRQGKEMEVPLQSVLVMPKEELFSGGTGNALKMYKRRVEDLRDLAEQVRNIEPQLREALQGEAARTKVYSF